MVDHLLDEHEQSERVRGWLRQNGAGLFAGVVLGPYATREQAEETGRGIGMPSFVVTTQDSPSQ